MAVPDRRRGDLDALRDFSRRSLDRHRATCRRRACPSRLFERSTTCWSSVTASLQPGYDMRPRSRSRSRWSAACNTCTADGARSWSCVTSWETRAAEVANMLSVGEASVNSALQRARATHDARTSRHPAIARRCRDQRARAGAARLVRRGVRRRRHRPGGAAADRATRCSAILASRSSTGHGDGRTCWTAKPVCDAPAGRRVRLVPTRTDYQPAFGHYIDDAQAPIGRYYGIIVVTLEGAGVFRDHPVR